MIQWLRGFYGRNVGLLKLLGAIGAVIAIVRVATDLVHAADRTIAAVEANTLANSQLAKGLSDHAGKKWHPEAGEEITALKARNELAQKELSALRADFRSLGSDIRRAFHIPETPEAEHED